MKLEDKVAVITGGTSGIGLATAHAYRREGAELVISGRDPDKLDAAATELGESVLPVRGDVTNADDLGRLFATTEEAFGRVDVLFANAGGINFTPLGQTTEEDFAAATDLNFKSVFFTVQAALTNLAEGASVIITGNALSSAPVVGPSVAIAAKAATTALARTMAVELAPRGIRVNVLSPGPTAEDPAGSGMPDEVVSQIVRRVPLGRFGTPRDAAEVAVFLGSDDSAFMTGADLPVGGGIGMGWVPPT